MSLALIEPGGDTAAKFGILQPGQRKQGSLDSADLTQGHKQVVLPGVPCQFADHQGRTDRALAE